MKTVIVGSVLIGFLLTPIVMFGQEAQDENEPGPPPQRGEWAGRRLGLRGNEGKRFEGNGPADFIDRLKQEDPERFEELMKLRETDRPAFMKELRKMAMERRGKTGDRPRKERPEEIRCRELREQFLAAQTDEEKARVKAELATAVGEAFEARLNVSKERLAALEKEIERFRAHIQKLEANRQEVVERRLDELTRSPDLDWDARW